ncbi:MAG: alpha/beta hydrolase [Brevundimonas sp.]|uniref:alpha/beta hydrolase family protein n=1 Tax=Brevundimonas sp. TaxID=1871086 RepID=UPI002489C092|nr:alpha/beta hydrolase [Brevundimonas sp.]MDI1325822.1 alpha/beta hydrolase [Brevundimonas sp.]
MRPPLAALAASISVAACMSSPAPVDPVETRTPITFGQLLNQPRQSGDRRIAYGADPLQFGELWVPKSGRRHPVIVLIHGGCWRADLPGTELMDHMAADLRDRGYAVWNLEYRRIGHSGGGYPGTFQDVAAGLDYLRVLAPKYGLDLRRVAVSGHSAGGHLAIWAAARDRLPESSPSRVADPLPVRGVVSLAAIADLRAYRETGPDACGGPPTIDSLVGVQETNGREVFADTSPPSLLPLGDRQVVVSGALDHIVPPRFGQAYAAAAASAGDPATSVVLEGAGHFELIDPTSAVWPRILEAYSGLLR